MTENELNQAPDQSEALRWSVNQEYIAMPNVPNSLTFAGCGIVIDLDTGNVTIPENLNLTDVSRAFWDAVMRLTGRKCGFD